MTAQKESPAGGRGNPEVSLAAGKIDPDNISHRNLSQAEAWRLACVVFGSELPAPRRETCGTSADGIRYWRVTR